MVKRIRGAHGTQSVPFVKTHQTLVDDEIMDRKSSTSPLVLNSDEKLNVVSEYYLLENNL